MYKKITLTTLKMVCFIFYFTIFVTNAFFIYFISKDHDIKEPRMVGELKNLCDNSKDIKPHSKVLSYSIFGTIQKYYDGIPLVIQAKRSSELYKNWTIRIYHDGHVPPDIEKRFEKDDDILFCHGHKIPRFGNLSDIFQMYWRFLPLGDPTVDIFCSRDLDSTILSREEDAVREFIASDMLLHTMRDHQYHDLPLLGGMWCFQNRLDRDRGRNYIADIITKARGSRSRNDQPILNSVVWNDLSRYNLSDKVLQHDSHFCKKFGKSRPFPKQRADNFTYIGCEQHDCRKTKFKLGKCPTECRPSYGKTWEYC